MKGKLFLLIVIFLWIGVLYKSKIFETLYLPIDVKIIQTSTNLKYLDQPYKIKYVEVIKIDKLLFPNRRYLYHPLYGNLRFYNNFLMEINTSFFISKDNNVTFIIASDDGFRLKVDNKKICEFIKDRPMRENVCKINLRKGKHTLFIKYFQGYGNLGLIGMYRINNKNYYIGENSGALTFENN